MAGTISQRISLEGSDDIRKKLQELGIAGEKAFKQIQDAAAKPITDPAQVDKTKQAIDGLVTASTKLGQQFRALTGDTQAFGSAGAKAGQDTTSGMNQAASAAEKTSAGFKSAASEANNLGIRIGVVAGLVAAATNKLIGMLGQLKSALAPSELLKGTVETGKAIDAQADKLKLTVPEWLKLSKAISAAGISEETFIEGTSKLAKKFADAKGGFAELVPGTLVSTSKGFAAVVTDLAKQIAMLGDTAAAAKLGTAAFGENWKDIIKALTGGKEAAKAADDVFDKLAKVDRALSPDQAERAAQLAKGWDVLGKAIRAAKDQIGTVFLDSALLRAEWLIKLIDASRELFKTWQQLAEEKKAAFLEGLGDSPAEFVFKTLIATGQLLAGIWSGALVPAGEKLMEIIKGVASSFEGVSGSQVAAFFITAAAAAVGLALALKGLSLLLTPLTLLMGLFSPFGAVLLAAGAAALLFWDQLSKGASDAAALIPAELADIKDAIAKLFAGDFAGFWDQFSTAAVAAFQKIMAAAAQTELGKVLIQQFNQLKTELPGAIELIIKAFLSILPIADKVAGVLNTVFRTDQFTGTGVVALAIFGQMTGGLQVLQEVAVTAGVALTGLLGVLGLLITAFGAVPVAIGLIITAIGLLVVALINLDWGKMGQEAIAGWNAVTGAIGTAITAVDQFIGKIVGIVWDTISNAGVAAWNAITGAINGAIDAIKRFLGLKGSGGTPGETTPAPGNARGGLIGGRGSGTSDSNLSWVSRGEHIMPARAVRQPGVLAFLEALRRSGGDLARVLDGMGRFAAGGLVPAMPAFAGGGAGGGGMAHLGVIDLRTDHGIASVMASQDAVTQLQRLAVQKRMTSTGKKPGFIS